MEFYRSNLHANRTLRILAVSLMLFFSSLSVVAHARSDVKTNGLKPDTRESVQNIGQALLLAKRSYKENQNTAALRDSIQQTRQLVNELTRPIMTQQIQLTKPNKTPQNTSNARPKSLPSDWHQARASEITQLQAASAKLRSQCQSIQSARNVKASPSLLDSVASFFTGKSNLNNSTKFVIEPVTDNALTHLEKIDSDIKIALALPAAQRQQRLHELAEELNISSKPVQADIKDNVAPTFSNRTQHRRSW